MRVGSIHGGLIDGRLEVRAFNHSTLCLKLKGLGFRV